MKTFRYLSVAALLWLSCAVALAQRQYVDISVALRSGPGSTYGSLTVVPWGAALTVEHGGKGDWVPVVYGGRRGYIPRSHLRRVRPSSHHYNWQCQCKDCRKAAKKAAKKHRKHDNGRHRGHHKH